ncbi:MAG: extracellular solute-binding protein [Rhizobiaceae bacterium]
MNPRSTVISGLLASAVLFVSVTAAMAQDNWRTVSSLIGKSKYAEKFERYDHVNPDAPKGGTVNLIAIGAFDSFNPFIVRGTPAAGLTAFTGGLPYDTLMAQSVEEPGTSYPLLAEAFKYPDDYSSATYRLNPKARFHDGEPVTAEDVVWSFEILKANYPLYNQYFHNVTEAVILSEREVEFRFDQKNNRELPHIMGDMPVLPKHWWEGTDADGKKRDISAPTLEPPLGSGPYRIKSFKPGDEIVWERVEDYWGKDLPVKIGRENFDRRRYTYFLDRNSAWPGFIKGGLEDYRRENRSRRWAKEYNFPAFEAGDVVRGEFPEGSGQPMQGFVINTRLDKFKDRRVREALTWAFDFESMNKTQFFGLYARTDSYFEGGELASSGLPEGLELEILEQYRGQIPDEVFEKPFELPVYTGDNRSDRKHLARAFKLLKEAGYTRKGSQLVGADGKPLAIEILGNDETDARIAAPYIEQLKKLGVDASMRVIDSNQYINRVRSFEFELTTSGFQQSLSPGNEQRDFWSSPAADVPGSRNLAGIKDPVIDDLVDKIIFAKNREELIATTHALDRVLLWNFYVIPQWHNPDIWMAWWDKFGMPPTQPAYAGIDINSWWIDAEKAAALDKKLGGGN